MVVMRSGELTGDQLKQGCGATRRNLGKDAGFAGNQALVLLLGLWAMILWHYDVACAAYVLRGFLC